MPYRGRPSAGCATCRRRKIKCDLRPAGCEKCEKSGWTCEGYRDIGSLMFFDESEHVKTKAKTAQQRKQSERASTLKTTKKAIAAKEAVRNVDPQVSPSNDSSTDSSDSTNSLSAAPASDISPCLDDLAVGWFFDKYVFKYNDRREIWDIEDGNGCLRTSIIALGLAGLTKKTGTTDVITHPTARKYYLAAIQQTNQALRCPKEVTSDSTLQAINILAIFEILSGQEKSLIAWKDHIHGAASLLHLRGPEQFKTHTGARLFLQTTSNLIITCLARRLPLPDDVMEMQEIAAQYVPDCHDPVWRSHCNGIRLANLNARTLPGQVPRVPSDAQDMIIEALNIFQEFNDILASAPDEWRPIVVNDTGPMIYADYYYVFRTSLMTQMFCSICAYRMHLITIMNVALRVGAIEPAFYLEPHQVDQLEIALASTKDLQYAILASIPQHFIDRSQHAVALGTSSTSIEDMLWKGFGSKDYSPFTDAERRLHDLPFVRLAGGYLIQFPLFAAGSVDPPGGPIRTWCVGMLRLLGQTTGTSHAFVLADHLEIASGKGLMR